MSIANENDIAIEIAKITADVDLLFFGDQSKKYASDLVNLADIKLRIGKLEEALNLCNRAIEIDDLFADDTTYTSERADTHSVAAAILLQMGQTEKASFHAVKAKELRANS